MEDRERHLGGSVSGLFGHEETDRQWIDSQRDRIQAALWEGRLQALLDDSMTVICIKDPRGRYLMVNRWVEIMFHTTREKVVGKTDHDLFPEEVADALRASDSEALRSEAPLRFKQFLVHKEGEYACEVTKFTLHGRDGNVYAVCSIINDVTRLERTEEALGESEARFRSLVQNSSDAFIILDADGTIRYQSPSVERIFQYPPEDMIGKNAFDYIHPDDAGRVHGEFSRMVEEPGSLLAPVEYRFRHADGSWRYLESVGANQIDDPYIGGIVVNTRDVTERKRAEEALKNSEERYRQLVENSPETIAVIIEDEIAFANPAGVSLAGVDGPEELVGRSYLDFVHPDFHEIVKERVSRAREGTPMELFQERFLRPDGSTVDVEAVAIPTTYEGKPAIHSVVRDITGRVEAEAKLRESEARFRSMVQNSSDVFVIVDADGTIHYESLALERMLGYPLGENAGSGVFDHMHPKDVARQKVAFAEAVEKPGVRPPERFRLRHKDGSWRHVEVIRNNLLEDPGVRGIASNLRDVTERVQAEARLRESEERFRSAFEDAAIGMALVSPPSSSPTSDRRYLRVNRALCEMLGYTEVELLSKTSSDITHPDDFDISRARAQQLVEDGREYKLEKRYFHADGHVVWAVLNVALVRDPEGNLSHLITQYQDVTERKQTEEALKESEANLAQAQRIAHVGSWEWDVVNDEVSWSDEVFRIYGFSPGAFVPTLEKMMEIVHLDDRELLRENIDGALHENKPYDFNHRIVRPDGEARVVHRRAEVDFGEEGEPLRMIGTVHDITERERAEEDLKESEERYRAVMEQSVESIFLFDVETRGILESNTAFQTLSGYTSEELRGMTSYDLIALERDIIDSNVQRDLQERRRFAGEQKYRRKDGSLVDVEASMTVIPYCGREAICILARDVTERKQAEEALRASEERFRSAFEDAPIGVALVDLDGRYLRVNRALCEMLGYPEDYLLGKAALEIIHPEDREVSANHVRRTLEKGAGNYTLERRYIRDDGHVVWNLVSVSLIQDSRGEPSHFVCLHQDISERKALEDRLRYQAFHDPLTGLPNRALFLDRLRQALARAGRLGEPVAVLFVDLDDFKTVNDSLGHEAGNVLLVGVGESLRDSVRPGDTVARLFGDEFAILLEAPTGAQEARRVTERIGERLRASFDLGGQELHVSPSVGIALGETSEERPEELLRRADLAMYTAKRRGKARYDMFTPSMDDRATKQLSLENELRRAAEREEFEVYYQPIIELASGKIDSMEALVRWRHPERGLVSPMEFILLAEETGLIRTIGQWVLEVACRQACEWRAKYPDNPPRISVNFSASQFSQQPDVTSRVLRETGLDPGGLQLEITERAMMDNVEFSVGKLNRLKGLGVRFAIDDYGMGYSCLYYLKHMPVDYLKIDRTFITGLGKDSGDMDIVSATIDLAHALGLKVVAEGVETAAQLETLKKLGCDLAQGFYLSRPLPSKAASALLSGSLLSRE